ncbi:hypothetical protein DAD99_09695 [Pseudarthrobacter sp. AB1]|nr:hypothetical protein [Pseudarthrobacter sp. AB1]
MPDAIHTRALAAGPPSADQGNASRRERQTRLLVLPQAPHWLATALLLATAVVALGLTVQLIPGASTGELGVDQDISRHHVALLTGAAMALNLLFGPAAGVLAIGAVALFLLVARGAPVNAVAFSLMASSGWVASELFKLLIERQRPDPTLLFDPLAPEIGPDSFPSGHVTFAVTLAFAVYFLARGTRWSKFAAVGGVVVTVVVAWSRLYIGVHYPSDVVGSLLAGSMAVILTAGLWNRLAPIAWRRLQGSAATRRFLT